MKDTITTLRFDATGTGHCLYTEAVDLASIGHLQIERATRVEFNNVRQAWEVHDLTGALLYSSPSRTTCLDWERQFLSQR